MYCSSGSEWCVARSLAPLSLSLPTATDELKGQLLEMGICHVLIPLTNSPSSEVQGNSAAALGNLSSKGKRSSLSRVRLILIHCQMAVRLLMTTLPSMTFGRNQKGACTSTCIAS